MDKLPNNWKVEKIGNIINVKSSKRIFADEYVSDGVPFYRSKEIVELATNGFTNSELCIPIKKYEEIKQKFGVPQKGDLLLTSVGTIGKTWIVDDRQFYYKDGNLTQLERNNNVNMNFIQYYFLSPLFTESINSKVSGTAYNALTIQKINLLELPIPPLPEQTRIVNKLDTLFNRIDKSIALLGESIKQTQALNDATFDLLFDDLSKKYGSVPLLKYVEFIGGSQPPKNEFSNDIKDGFVRLIQIRDYKSADFVVYINEKSTTKFCEVDDVMIGRYGPPVFQILRGLKGAYNVALMKAVPNEKYILKDYLFYFLQNSKIQNYIISISQRSAGQSGVNKKALEMYDIVVPPLKVQQKVVEEISRLQEKLKLMLKYQQSKLTYLKALKASILDKAFKGEL